MPSPFKTNFPPITGVRWFNLSVLTITPAIAGYGLLVAPILRGTVLFATLYYVFSMLGITAGMMLCLFAGPWKSQYFEGYHRLWSHRSYNASLPLQILLICGGTSAVQGSCFWWARAHRSHHRHTDTDLDPYDANRGLLWTHVGWMVFKSGLRSGGADISDLRRDPLVQWQHHWYFYLAPIFGIVLPTIVPGFLWNDWFGGLCFSGALRLTIAHHSTFCINSIAHYLGSASYDDVLTPRDHLLSAILTMGEGYHNFHHQFPMDYRNAFRWYQYDPTKWFIAFSSMVGLATHLRVFPSNEVEKGAFTMKLKELRKIQDSLTWPVPLEQLPVISWETFQKESKERTMILVSGFIHDVSSFTNKHPGGSHFLVKNSGKDMTASFYGGTYGHSNAAHNLLSMMRIAILKGGMEIVGQQHEPPGQQLYIAETMQTHDRTYISNDERPEISLSRTSSAC